MDLQPKGKIIKSFYNELPEDYEEALTYLSNQLDGFSKYVGIVKFDMNIITKLGEDAVIIAKQKGLEVFYDLSSENLSTQVYLATCRGVKIINVNVSGDINLLQLAKSSMEMALLENKKLRRPILIASTDSVDVDCNTILSGNVIKSSLKFVINVFNLNYDGVMCSTSEIHYLKNDNYLPENFLFITPSIVPEWSFFYDKDSFMTPSEAIKAGSDLIVVDNSMKFIDGAKKILSEVTASMSA